MTYTLKVSGNAVRLILRALGRYGAIKQSEEAKELAQKIETEFNKQRGKHGNYKPDRRQACEVERRTL